MPILANRPFELAPGWNLGAGQRVPAEVWNGLGKGKQKALIAGRFVLQREGDDAETAPPAEFDQEHADRIAALVAEGERPVERRTIDPWAQEEAATVAPTRSELAARSGPVVTYTCPECQATFASKQALGGHQRGHSKQRQKARKVA